MLLGGEAIALTKAGRKTWGARFRFERPSEDRLTLDGEMDGMRLHLQLERVGFDTFRLVNSGFRTGRAGFYDPRVMRLMPVGVAGPA